MMKSRFLPFVLLLLPYCANGEQQAITNDILFKGVTKQSTDYSCGAAALSTLITGLVENARISEKDVIDEIAKLSDNRDSQGYTLSDLMEVSKNLEHYAEWRKVPVSQLPKIKIPVILLIGLNSKFPHFVVLKGIVDDQAFLADSIRGNIRIPYKKLTEEGVTEKYKDWFVMAIEPSANIPKDSNLYLAEDKFSSHFTVEQSSAITLSTLPKANQLFASYDFSGSFGSAKVGEADAATSNYTHSLNVRYGVTESLEVTARISVSDTDITLTRDDINLGHLRQTFGDQFKQYALGVNKRFKLDDAGRTGLIAGISGSVKEPSSTWGGKLNVLGYTNTSYAQFILGGSIGKEFSTIENISTGLPKYTTSGVISANKPFADKYLGSLSFSVDNSHEKKSAKIKSDPTLTLSSGITYVLDKHFQVTPSFGYSFNNGENYAFGASFAYVGSW